MPVRALVRTRSRTTATRYGTAARPVTLAIALACAALLVTGCGGGHDEASSIVRTTTNIAGAGVVGLTRDTSQACALPSAPDRTGPVRVTHAGGVTEVPADPRRIVVLTTSALDATCALGLWERVVGAVTVDGPRPQPMYLGYGVTEVPGVGSAAQPDLAGIAALRPDLILGDVAAGAADFDSLSDIAPTVLVGDPVNWQAGFDAYASGLNRRAAAATVLEQYRAQARDTGVAIAAGQSQASVLRFTGDAIEIQGSDSFAGQVLADAGVQRPQTQRGTSTVIADGDLRTEAEGDIVYVDFAGEAGREHGERVLRSDEWKELGAATDRRVFAVEDSVWHGGGPTAARALLVDLQGTLNGYVTD